MSSPYLLYVTASPMGDNSRSRALGEVFLNAFKEKVSYIMILIEIFSP